MRAEIWKRVYAKYPVTEKERNCQQEKKRMIEIRDLYRKRLIDEENNKEKKQYDVKDL